MFVFLGVFSTSGCASVVGIIVADVHRGQGALVVTVDGVGPVVQTLAEDGGLTLGLTRRTYIYPDDVGAVPESGRHYGVVALPAASPVALDTRTLGISLRTTRTQIGVTVGYIGTAILAQVDADDSMYMDLSFAPADPRGTRLTYCRKGTSCWSDRDGDHVH